MRGWLTVLAVTIHHCELLRAMGNETLEAKSVIARESSKPLRWHRSSK